MKTCLNTSVYLIIVLFALSTSINLIAEEIHPAKKDYSTKHHTIYGEDNDTIVTCRNIYETGAYRKNAGFTRAPTLAGCHVGQVVGGIIGAPFMLIYAPACAGADRGDCDTYKSPIEDGSEFFGRVLGHALGAPFFILEAIFAGDKD